MRKLITFSAFLLFSISIFSQNLLDQYEGVKSITFIEHRGKTEKKERKISKTLIFDKSGILSNVKFKSYETKYQSKDGKLIMKRTDVENCTQSYEITILEDEHILRSTDISKGQSGCPFAPDYPVFGGLNFDTLFQDIEQIIPKKGKEYYMLVRKFSKEKNSRLDLSYIGSFRSNSLKLSTITERLILDDGLVLVRIYARSNTKILLQEQKVEDKHGAYITTLDKNFLFTDSQGAQPRYDYEYDAKGNWIRRTPKIMKEGRIWYDERKITYHQ